MSKKTNNKKVDLFKKVKFLILDVDGVLTKGEIIYDDKGRELKIFNVKDGLGIFLLDKVGIKTVFLTAKSSAVVRRRAQDMHVSEVIGGVLPKESVLSKISSKYKVNPENICFMGDDLIDIGLMERVGIAVTVSDAPQMVKKYASYITAKEGGQGAVREVVELIFKAQRLEERVIEIVKSPRK